MSTGNALDARILRLEARLMRRVADLQQRLLSISQSLQWRQRATCLAWNLGAAAGVLVVLRALRRLQEVRAGTSSGRAPDVAASTQNMARRLPGL